MKAASDKVFCVVIISGQMRIRVVGKTRDREQGYLWASNVRLCLKEAGADYRWDVALWREADVARVLCEFRRENVETPTWQRKEVAS